MGYKVSPAPLGPTAQRSTNVQAHYNGCLVLYSGAKALWWGGGPETRVVHL